MLTATDEHLAVELTQIHSPRPARTPPKPASPRSNCSTPIGVDLKVDDDVRIDIATSTTDAVTHDVPHDVDAGADEKEKEEQASEVSFSSSDSDVTSFSRHEHLPMFSTPRGSRAPSPHHTNTVPPPAEVTAHINRMLFLTHDVEARIMMHIYASWILPYLDKMLKWPITLLTLLTGTSMWSSSALTPAWFLALATVQGVILLLMTMQFYFDFESRAQRHAQLASQYAILHRRLNHQFFKYQRRVHGLPPWGETSRVEGEGEHSPPVVAEIDRKWNQFFRSVETEFRDILELRPPEYIVEQIREWTLYQGWIRTGLFLYFRSSMCPVTYTLNEVMSMLTLTRMQLIEFLRWQRTQFHLSTQLQTMPLLDVDLQCMTKGLLVFHAIIELNLPFALLQRWRSTAMPPTEEEEGEVSAVSSADISCVEASSCGLFVCCVSEEALHARFTASGGGDQTPAPVSQ